MSIQQIMEQLTTCRQEFLEKQDAIEESFNQDLNKCLTEIAQNIQNIIDVLLKIFS